MKKSKKNILIALALLLLALLSGAVYVAQLFLTPNVNTRSGKTEYLYLRADDDFNDVISQLQEKALVKSPGKLTRVARYFKYQTVLPGKYAVTDGMNNFTLIRNLSKGRQTPVRLTFNNIRTKEQLAGRLAAQLMPDSVEILTLLNDTAFLQRYALNPYNSVSLFLPNTYEMRWNLSAEALFDRMNTEYSRFWNDERKQKAAAIPLTPEEVITLASIVDAETNYTPEKPTVAGMYINRLKINMPLQADPTVVFGVSDFSIRRVTGAHLRVESPYNTYRNRGLPPGPIRIPSIAGIDAVLNYVKSDFIYMCAKETFTGEHNFATTWAEHQRNAAIYQKALNERGVK